MQSNKWALLLVLVFLLTIPFTVHAQGTSLTPSAIIAAVNALRASRGLAPYTVDSELMAYAQEHAEYMARTGRATHQHSDGSMPNERGASENIAGGTVGMMTASFIVNTVWADPVHMNTMIGYTGGTIGVGVASNGENEYISLDVRPTGRVSGTGSTGGSASNPSTPAATVALIAPMLTATPRSDGAVYHTVGYGQSLWGIAIAYGVKINDIRALNGLPADSTTIYEGQRLLIFPAGSVTPPAGALPTTAETTEAPTLPPTATRSPPTAARPASTATAAPEETPTPSVTPTSTPAPLSGFHLDTRSILAGLAFAAAAMLMVVFLLSFRK